MQGIIDYLTGPSLDAKVLRDNFVFKLVPMLNVDGVVVGNYRCSLAGLDLNRMWREPSRRLTPTIYATKAMLRRLQEDREVVLFCDLHGHSRKHNVFCYGCENAKGDRQGRPFQVCTIPPARHTLVTHLPPTHHPLRSTRHQAPCAG